MQNQFDDLKLDDRALEETANLIVMYCNSQQAIIREYLQQMHAISNEWRDDETMGKVLQEVHMLTNNVEKIMNVIRSKYPRYFKERAELIRARSNNNI